jgi:hypothetical protein
MYTSKLVVGKSCHCSACRNIHWQSGAKAFIKKETNRAVRRAGKDAIKKGREPVMSFGGFYP